MRKTPKMLTKALSGVVALFFVTFVAAPPAFASANLQISQTTGLQDGQKVTISGSGFTPNLSNIAVGQCVEGMKGPADCNTAGGADFVAADANGNFGPITLIFKEKFGTFDCTKQQCVVGAQPLPGAVDAATLKANTFYADLSFGDAPAASAASEEPTTTAAPATSGEELPKTGPGQELALALTLGLLLFLLGGATLWFVPRQRGGVA